MDKEKTLLSLSIEIDSIKAHINRLRKSNYQINDLDVDMLKKKTIEFYELVFELENPSEIKEEVIIEDVVVEKHPVIEEVKAEVMIEPEVVIEPVREPDVKIEPEPIIEKDIEIEAPIEEVPSEETPVEEIVEPKVDIVPEPAEEPVPEVIPELEPEKPQKTAKQSNYDLFSASADGAIAEKYKVSEEPSIAEKMQKSQITNIREAIGINEKFLFINELFNGDMGRYNKILDDINDLTTKQGVDTYLFELKIQFQWSDDNEAYTKLIELLDRKFQ